MRGQLPRSRFWKRSVLHEYDRFLTCRQEQTSCCPRWHLHPISNFVLNTVFGMTCGLDITLIHILALPAQLRKSFWRSFREKNRSRTVKPYQFHNFQFKCESIVPYAPAGFICTVSFISPDRNAAIALAYRGCYETDWRQNEWKWLTTP